MSVDRDLLRDWHRLFGLLLIDFFTDSPFTVDVERDLSQQQQFLDVIILRRRRGRFTGRLPDGLEDLADHNLITFKSHHETLDAWTMKELIGHYVAYRKLISPSPSELLPEDRFKLFAVAARYPQHLSSQIPWQDRQSGVYDCTWGTDVVRVIAAADLPREPHNAALHLFSASPELVGFGRQAYRQRSEDGSRLLGQLFKEYREEFTMSYTWADFNRWYTKSHFQDLTAEEQAEAVQTLSPQQQREILARLLASLPADQIRQQVDKLAAGSQTKPSKPRRKK